MANVTKSNELATRLITSVRTSWQSLSNQLRLFLFKNNVFLTRSGRAYQKQLAAALQQRLNSKDNSRQFAQKLPKDAVTKQLTLAIILEDFIQALHEHTQLGHRCFDQFGRFVSEEPMGAFYSKAAFKAHINAIEKTLQTSKHRQKLLAIVNYMANFFDNINEDDKNSYTEVLLTELNKLVRNSRLVKQPKQKVITLSQSESIKDHLNAILNTVHHDQQSTLNNLREQLTDKYTEISRNSQQVAERINKEANLDAVFEQKNTSTKKIEQKYKDLVRERKELLNNAQDALYLNQFLQTYADAKNITSVQILEQAIMKKASEDKYLYLAFCNLFNHDSQITQRVQDSLTYSGHNLNNLTPETLSIAISQFYKNQTRTDLLNNIQQQFHLFYSPKILHWRELIGTVSAIAAVTTSLVLLSNPWLLAIALPASISLGFVVNLSLSALTSHFTERLTTEMTSRYSGLFGIFKRIEQKFYVNQLMKSLSNENKNSIAQFMASRRAMHRDLIKLPFTQVISSLLEVMLNYSNNLPCKNAIRTIIDQAKQQSLQAQSKPRVEINLHSPDAVVNELQQNRQPDMPVNSNQAAAFDETVANTDPQELTTAVTNNEEQLTLSSDHRIDCTNPSAHKLLSTENSRALQQQAEQNSSVSKPYLVISKMSTASEQNSEVQSSSPNMKRSNFSVY